MLKTRGCFGRATQLAQRHTALEMGHALRGLIAIARSQLATASS